MEEQTTLLPVGGQLPWGEEEGPMQVGPEGRRAVLKSVASAPKEGNVPTSCSVRALRLGSLETGSDWLSPSGLLHLCQLCLHDQD